SSSLLSSYYPAHNRPLHSFPTRRSSDLQKALGTGRVVAAFFGDGATEEGAFYESLNFAALRQLPVLFVCENNFLAIHEPITKRQDRKSTRLNSSHRTISYAVFCLKKKNK